MKPLQQVQWVLDSSEPDWLKAFRKENLELSEKLSAPYSGYFDVKAFEQRLFPATQSEKIVCKVEGKNVSASALGELDEKDSKDVRRLLEQEPAQDKFEAFQNAMFSSSFFVRVPSGEKASIDIEWKPLHENANAKIIVLAEPESEVEISAYSSATKTFHQSILLNAQENSTVKFAHLDQSNADYFFASQRNIVERDAKIAFGHAWLGGEKARLLNVSRLKGQGASVEQREIVFANHQQEFDYKSTTLHEATDCSSHTLFKAVVDHEAQTVFDGMIKVLPNAQRTNALLEAHGILLSNTAKCNNIPGLEIEANDVKCTHSASVHPIEEEQLFYLESRGIARQQAKKMIIVGFLQALAYELPVQKLQEKVLPALEEKYEETK